LQRLPRRPRASAGSLPHPPRRSRPRAAARRSSATAQARRTCFMPCSNIARVRRFLSAIFSVRHPRKRTPDTGLTSIRVAKLGNAYTGQRRTSPQGPQVKTTDQQSVIYAALGLPLPGTLSISLIPPKALVVVDVAGDTFKTFCFTDAEPGAPLQPARAARHPRFPSLCGGRARMLRHRPDRLHR
jgi:hypothetical protein